ncbi:phospholipase D family protein [Acinetobacter puyangensis]|uniref:phospholipase D n=1 Tax=Acinetobacter puyangensis TaxID=1096779 RepID=A0A240ECR5_9GAMM|nr:phospholipase D family protein [Acinetobacter puyangensis]SNX46507.1 Phosphatidylserine/phosphatidylglycerophosphate/cardiolipin synthase [Acinetobacter puyangensis]
MRIFQRIQQKLNWSAKRYLAVIAVVLFLTYVASAIYQVYKPLPKGLNYKSPSRPSAVEFLGDQTFLNASGQVQNEQQIFAAVLTLIDQAQTTIVLDMFLFNDSVGKSNVKHQPLSEQLTQALLQKKALNPQIEIKVISDPINTVYGGISADNFHQLQKNGIDVIFTDLRPLRASNPVWSGFWYMCCQQVGNNPQGGWLPNPLGEGNVTLRSYLELLNFKANHRKTLVVDTLQGWKALISSANPHDGSSQHSNVAMIVQGKLATDVLDSERTVAKFSQGDVPMVVMAEPGPDTTLAQAQILTEKAIYDEILQSINSLKSGEQLDLMMFYLSERQIIEAIKAAQARGVQVRVVLDPNKDAFGRQKNGIPNRQVAWELHQAKVDVRWCLTHGEQCHSKLLILSRADDTKQVILGSANYTARNLKNYNLETNISVTGKASYPALVDAQQYFETVWRNTPEKNMTVDYSEYQDESRLKYWLYRFMEWSGLSTF